MAKRVARKKNNSLEVSDINSQPQARKIDVSKLLSYLNRINTNQLLVLLLIIAAFLIGVLYTKVSYLEKNQAPTTATVPTQQGTQPQGPVAGKKVSEGHFPIKGNKNAKVTIVEFADFRCPFCEQFFSQTEPQLFKDYIDTGKVKFAFRQFPFLGPASVVAANAAECANDQGQFWAFHDWLYKNQPPESDTSMYTTDGMTNAAVSLGMNGDTFRSCLDGKKDDAKATADMTEGQNLGVNGTPTFFVNGTPLVGAQPYAAFQQLIDSELAKVK
jgi:protein-disulfide isomerase